MEQSSDAPRVWPDVPLFFDIAGAEVPAPAKARWDFKHIRVIGFVDHLEQFGDLNVKWNLNQLFADYPFDPCPDPKWGVVNPTYRNLMAASMKFDSPQDFSFYQVPQVIRSLQLIEEYVEPYWTQPPYPWSKVWGVFEYDTAAGWPFSAFGLKKKWQLFQFDDAFVRYMVEAVMLDADVFFRTTPKREFLKLSMIEIDKLRLFCFPGAHFIAWQARLYGNQSKAIQNTKWFKLGASMKNGGAHLLTKELECADGEFVVEFDLPRCDKNFKLMEWIYTMRNKFLQTTDPLDRKAAEWVKRNMVTGNVILWDGTVIQTKTQNGSGQWLTPDDTCPWSACIYLTLAQLAYPEVQQHELRNLTLHIYSDDFRGKFGRQFALLRDGEWVARQLKTIFNIEADPKEWKVYNGPDGSHFLGADTILSEGIYYAHYNPDRLRAAFKYVEGTLDVGQELFRLLQLLIMAWPNRPLFIELREIYLALLRRFSASSDVAVKLMVGRGVPNVAEMRRVHSGLESNFNSLGVGSHEFFPPPMDGRRCELQSSMNGDKNAKTEGKRIKTKAGQLAKAVRKVKATNSGGSKDAGKASAPDSRKGGGGDNGNAKGGKKGSGNVDRLGTQHGQGVGSGSDGSSTSSAGPVLKAPPPPPKPKVVVPQVIRAKEAILYKQSGDKKVSIGRIQRSVGTAPLPKVRMESKGNSVSTSRSIRFAGMKAHSFTDKKGEHFQFQCQQFLGEINTNCGALEAAVVGPGKRLFCRKINPATLGGAIFQESKNWQRYEFRNLTFTYVATCDSADSGSLYMQYQADPTIPHIDTGVDEVSHASTLGGMEITTVYTEDPVHLPVNPAEMVKDLTEQTGNPTILTTEGYFIVSVLDDIAKNLQCGDVFVTYDIVFSEKMLSYSVSDTQDSTIYVSYSQSGYAGKSPNDGGFTDAFTGDPGFPPAPAAVIYMWIEDPPTDGPLYSGTAVCKGWRQKGVAGSVSALQWFTTNDLQLRPFENGQEFRIYLNTSAIDGAVDWEDGSIGCSFYAADNQEDFGEWLLGLSAVPAGTIDDVSAEMYFEVHWEPLNNIS